nr:isoprenyl transferase [Desulfocucumis palustris]
MIRNLINLWRGDKNVYQDEKSLMEQLDLSRLPRHVAIIMDGNGRWALRRGMPRAYGHRAGVESLREVVRVSAELGLQVLTVYAFSTENWKRPQEEVDILMDLLVEYLHKEIDELCGNNIRVRAIGKIGDLPRSAREALDIAARKSDNNTGLTLNIALNYGGRTELVEAVKSIGFSVAGGVLDPENINEKVISDNLYTAGQPDPDILIRPAGDYRVSNFLLWQLAYTEFWLTTVMWPDFRRVHMLQAMVDFQKRDRRFGGLKK